MEPSYYPKISEISLSVSRLSSLVDLTKSQYPYLPLTFSVWRKEKYEDLKLCCKSEDLHSATIQFHAEVDKRLLDEFMAKVKQGIKDSFKALRSTSANKLKEFKEDNQYESFMTEYIEAATSQLYRLEILGDLLTIPYGVPIGESYFLRKEFSSQDQANNEGIISGLINRHSKTVVSKGLSAIGGQIWGRIALLMIGGMNVLGFAGGMAISQAVDFAFSRMGKNKRIIKLQTQIHNFNQNSQKLQTCIRALTKLTEQYIHSDQQQVRSQIQKQFYSQVQAVFELQSDDSITIVEMKEGWKFVDLRAEEEDDEFQVIEKQEIPDQ